MDKKVEDLSRIGDPLCDHKLEDGSSAYEWRVYGIEYIKTCQICCNLDYTTRTIDKPTDHTQASTDMLINQLTGDLDTVSALKNVRGGVMVNRTIFDLEHEIGDLKSALMNRGIDVSKYILTGNSNVKSGGVAV